MHVRRGSDILGRRISTVTRLVVLRSEAVPVVVRSELFGDLFALRLKLLFVLLPLFALSTFLLGVADLLLVHALVGVLLRLVRLFYVGWHAWVPILEQSCSLCRNWFWTQLSIVARVDALGYVCCDVIGDIVARHLALASKLHDPGSRGLKHLIACRRKWCKLLAWLHTMPSKISKQSLHSRLMKWCRLVSLQKHIFLQDQICCGLD